MSNHKVAAIWCRVSTHDQRELSLDSQEVAVRKALEAEGYQVLPQHVLKVDWTSLDLMGCPEFLQLRRWIADGTVQAVGVLDRDRLQAQGLQRLVFLGFVSIALGATDNVVMGNFIGTDAAGTRALGTSAVTVEGKHNFVGGRTKEEGNVAAGGHGVRLTAGADFNFVAHNYVGTDVTGTAAFPSGGISVSGAQHNVIYSNLVSGGVSLTQGANFNLLQANRITRGRFGVEIRDAEGNLVVGNSLFNNGSNGYDGGQNNR